jgi:hypothetical protein
MSDIEVLEYIIENDCMYIDCGKCPIKIECKTSDYYKSTVRNMGKGIDMRKEIAKKALDKIKVEMMQEILRCQI